MQDTNLVVTINVLDFIVDSRKALALAKWGAKCKNEKTRERVCKSCIKIIKKSKIDRRAINCRSNRGIC